MSHKVNIYIDCEGNVDTDIYYSEKDIPKLKDFLGSLGYEIGDVGEHPKSIQKNKPFVYDKPRVAKKMAREVDWFNPKVIFIVIDSNKDDELILKDIVKESGIVDVNKSKATPFTIIARFRDIAREYEKWKTENHIIETNENRRELHKQFSEFYVELLKKKRQKRLQNGTKVFIQSVGEYGIVMGYKEKLGYLVKDKREFEKYYQRKDLLLKEER